MLSAATRINEQFNLSQNGLFQNVRNWVSVFEIPDE